MTKRVDGLGRRDVLRLGAVGGVSWLGAGAGAAGCGDPAFLAGPFAHGVASADPATDRIRIWTRISIPEGESPGSDIQLTATVARDEALTDVVAVEQVTARADADHTVELEVAGLEPDTTYFYGFDDGIQNSPLGRTRTAPSGTTSAVRFAFTSCASYAHGFFHSYARIAERTELNFVLHLGDYIYEYENGGYGSRRAYDPPHELLSLSDYRRRYAHYRRDPDVALLHGAHPLVVVWDDHEIANDAWVDGAFEHDPATEGPWEERKQAATQAHREWLPRREKEPGSLVRCLQFGDLLDLFVLDTRQVGRIRRPESKAEAELPGRRILGDAQREGLLRDLRASKARWKVVAQSVQFSPHPEFWNFDAWDGYVEERRLILEAFAEEPVEGVLFLCGDGHKSFADDLPLDPWDTERYRPESGEGSLAVELMTPAAVSPNLFGSDARDFEATVRAQSPHTKWVEAESRGYWTVEATESRVVADLFLVAGIESPMGGSERHAARFEVRAGETWLRRVPL